jgi:hypothetical protein
MQEWRSQTCLPRATDGESVDSSVDFVRMNQWLWAVSPMKMAKKKIDPP